MPSVDNIKLFIALKKIIGYRVKDPRYPIFPKHTSVLIPKTDYEVYEQCLNNQQRLICQYSTTRYV